LARWFVDPNGSAWLPSARAVELPTAANATTVTADMSPARNANPKLPEVRPVIANDVAAATAIAQTEKPGPHAIAATIWMMLPTIGFCRRKFPSDLNAPFQKQPCTQAAKR
jgi:hypothetical protein